MIHLQETYRHHAKNFVVQLLSRVRLSATPWTVTGQAFLSFTITWSLLKLISIESVMPSSHLIFCHPHLLLPSTFPSITSFPVTQCFTSHSQSIVCSFCFSISPSNEYSGLISFRIDWFDLAVQGTLKSLLKHHTLKVSVLQRSVFFMVQLSHLYMTIGKTIALTLWTFVGKVMSQLFNIPSRLIIAFLLRSRCLLISWLHSLSAVILEPKRIKSATVSSFSPSAMK